MLSWGRTLEQTPSKDWLLQSLPTLISLNLSGSIAIFTDCLFEGRTICAMFILGDQGGREGCSHMGSLPNPDRTKYSIRTLGTSQSQPNPGSLPVLGRVAHLKIHPEDSCKAGTHISTLRQSHQLQYRPEKGGNADMDDLCNEVSQVTKQGA